MRRASAGASARTSSSMGSRVPRRVSFSAIWPKRLTTRSSWCKGATETLRPRGVSGGPADAGVLRVRHQQLRRRGVAARRSRRMRRVRCRAPRANASSSRSRTSSPVSCSRSRRTWTRGTATASRSCACAPGKYSRGMRLYHTRLAQGSAGRRCADLHGRGPRAGRGSLRRRHHRSAQPRHHQHRRHVHRRARRLTFTGIPNFAPEMFRRAVLKDPLKMKALAQRVCRSCAKRARRSSSSRCATTT